MSHYAELRPQSLSCDPAPTREQWSHFTTDGGGLTFQFFWHPLSAAPDRSWQAHYQTALTFIHGWQARNQS